MENEKYKNYLYDLGFLLKEYALEAKRDFDQESDEFNAGYVSCFHRVISLMQQQAEAFDIPVEEIGLNGVDADEDLI